MTGNSLRAHDEENLPYRKRSDGDHRVNETIRTKQRNPDGQVVAAEGERDGKSGNCATTKLFAPGPVALTPRVYAKCDRDEGKNANPRQRNWGQRRTDSRGERSESRDAEGLSPTDAPILHSISDHELRSERKKVVEHRADEGEGGDDNDTKYRVHTPTLVEGRSGR
jgi:hypothetical protein